MREYRAKPRSPESTAGFVSTRCFYCDNPFWSIARRRRGKQSLTLLRPVWDHIVPWVAAHGTKKTGMVRCCGICNHGKRARVFESVDEIRAFLAVYWLDWQIVSEPSARLLRSLGQ